MVRKSEEYCCRYCLRKKREIPGTVPPFCCMQSMVWVRTVPKRLRLKPRASPRPRH